MINLELDKDEFRLLEILTEYGIKKEIEFYEETATLSKSMHPEVLHTAIHSIREKLAKIDREIK